MLMRSFRHKTPQRHRRPGTKSLLFILRVCHIGQQSAKRRRVLACSPEYEFLFLSLEPVRWHRQITDEINMNYDFFLSGNSSLTIMLHKSENGMNTGMTLMSSLQSTRSGLIATKRKTKVFASTFSGKCNSKAIQLITQIILLLSL